MRDSGSKGRSGISEGRSVPARQAVERKPILIDEWYEEEIVIKDLLDSLQVTEESLEQVILDQPQVLKKAGAHRIQCLRATTQAKTEVKLAEANLKILRADVQLEIRERQEKDGGKKQTETHIEAQVETDKDVVKELVAVQRKMEFYLRAEERDQASQLLMEAVRARGTAAKIYVELLGVLVAFGGKQLAQKQSTESLRKLSDEVRERYSK